MKYEKRHINPLAAEANTRFKELMTENHSCLNCGLGIDLTEDDVLAGEVECPHCGAAHAVVPTYELMEPIGC